MENNQFVKSVIIRNKKIITIIIGIKYYCVRNNTENLKWVNLKQANIVKYIIQ